LLHDLVGGDVLPGTAGVRGTLQSPFDEFLLVAPPGDAVLKGRQHEAGKRLAFTKHRLGLAAKFG